MGRSSMPEYFPFSIWSMAVFNSVSDIFWVNFSFYSMLILGLIGFNNISCIYGFVCVLGYSVEKNIFSVF